MATTIEKAQLYHQYRLPYPNVLANDLVKRIGVTPVIADIGAGTGQLTQLFMSYCDQIYTVEPDSAMRTSAHCL